MSEVLLNNQTLLFDADDTLWENNIYFEQAIAAFITDLDHKVHTPQQVREHLNHCERATIAEYGYGLQSFRRSLVACFEQLTQTPATPERHDRIVAFTEAIASQQMELLPGVAETLEGLASNHRLVLVTKGSVAEQTDKLERSGLRPLFSAVEVLAEKNEAAYRDLTERYSFEPNSTWMIGNSPKSDINPALAAGLNAIFIPHHATWVLEHEHVEEPTGSSQRLEVATIRDLTRYFSSQAVGTPQDSGPQQSQAETAQDVLLHD
jgi:putative hydrolase of the HAD superfamily